VTRVTERGQVSIPAQIREYMQQSFYNGFVGTVPAKITSEYNITWLATPIMETIYLSATITSDTIVFPEVPKHVRGATLNLTAPAFGNSSAPNRQSLGRSDSDNGTL